MYRKILDWNPKFRSSGWYQSSWSVDIASFFKYHGFWNFPWWFCIGLWWRHQPKDCVWEFGQACDVATNWNTCESKFLLSEGCRLVTTTVTISCPPSFEPWLEGRTGKRRDFWKFTRLQAYPWPKVFWVSWWSGKEPKESQLWKGNEDKC